MVKTDKTFRATGIPIECNLKMACEVLVKLLDTNCSSGLKLHSLALDAYDRGKTGTISFEIIPDQLTRGTQWTFQLPDEDVSNVNPDEEKYFQTPPQIVIDIHF